MVSSYTFAFSSNEQKIKEFKEDGESLKLLSKSLDYDEYVFESVHTENIRKYKEGQLVDERVDYVKISKLFHFREENFLVIKAGIKYSSFILNKLRKRINFVKSSTYFDYTSFLEYLKQKDMDFEPVKISIENYVREKYMVGDIFASLSSKPLLDELVKKHSSGINNLKLRLWDVGEIEISRDFVIKLYDANIEEYELISLLNLMFKFGGRTE